MNSEPWYKTTLRWAQTNLVEIDPERYDSQFWKDQWRRTKVQGVIVNAGGIVAYYPSAMPLHHRAIKLGDKDLYGDIVKAAREEGLKVIARMDSNRVARDFYRTHPDWICLDDTGKPYTQADKFVTCINSPYYSEYLPKIMEEIITRSKPDGFSDNSWPGMSRERICHCPNCSVQFFKFSGLALPKTVDWASENYRRWIRWNYQRRTKMWNFNNKITTAVGGKDCIWSGMIGGDILYNGNRFINLKSILNSTEIVMLDHQRRSLLDGFEQNTEAGKRLHEVGGWDKLIPESMPQYQLGAPAFRLASMPASEVRLWSSSAFAGGIQPWWHHIGATHEDRRQYATAEPIFNWHEKNQQYLHKREPLADVGLVWSQDNHDFHGQDNANERTLNPYRGAAWALDKAGITWLPVHADDVLKAKGRFKVLILANLAAMSDAQIHAVKAHADAGVSVIATSETSLFTEDGDRRDDFGLQDLFGIHRKNGAKGNIGPISGNIEISDRHTYLRLSPEIRKNVRGPNDETAPDANQKRHPIFNGLESTDTLPFGGFLPLVDVDKDVSVLSTYIPEFPIYPPETSWMRDPKTNLAAITVKEHASGAKLVWFVADIDRCFARDQSFEHALLISNAVQWMLDGKGYVSVHGGHGMISSTLYRQNNRYVLHLNNRLMTTKTPGRQNNLIPIGPIEIKVIKPKNSNAKEASLKVVGQQVAIRTEEDYFVMTVNEILDHELIVIEY